MMRRAMRGAILAVLCGLAGCCTSYGRVATVAARGGQDSPKFIWLDTAVEEAVNQLDVTGRDKQSIDEAFTNLSVRSGSNAVGIVVDHQASTIRIRWDRHNTIDFAAQVQTAIEREFSDKYHLQLRFEDVPCGWLGP